MTLVITKTISNQEDGNFAILLASYIGKIKFFLYNKSIAHNFTFVKLAHEQRRGRCKFKSRTKLKEPAFVLI